MNILVSGNPQITYFYKVFTRYTHFSQEPITIPVDGPNELSQDYPTRIRAKIPRHADMITDMSFVFRVPEMYSKLWTDVSDSTYVPAFRWIHMLGAFIIDNVGIYIGGSKIQEFPGEWFAVRATADMEADRYLKWRSMVGDVPELHTPEWGVYGKSPNYPFTAGEYPHTVADPSGGASAPSTPERTIRVPLPFWFSEHVGSALPLVALQLHEVEVQLTLRPLREIYRVMDEYFQREPVRFDRRLVPIPGIPTSVDPATPTDYDNLTMQNLYETAENPCRKLRNFFTDVGQGIPIQDGFVMDPHLEANYIYLTDRERRMFAERELQHLVHQVQTFRFPNTPTRTRLDMDAHGLVHRILFFGRRSDAIESRNDFLNCSNWKSLTQAPYWPLPLPAPQPNSGLLIPHSQRDILRAARLIVAGNEIFEEKPASWFELESPFQRTRGTGVTGLNPGSCVKPDDVMGPLYQIPFSLFASDHFQPSGSLNTSRLREIQLEVTPWELDPRSPFTYDFTVYVESLNTVKILNGMASLGYAV